MMTKEVPNPNLPMVNIDVHPATRIYLFIGA